MLLDGKVMVTQRDEHIYHEMLVHPAMLAHPDARNVLVVGGGDGGTIREITRYPGVERAVLAEIDDEVIEASQKYFPELTSGLSDPRVEIHVGDAAQYVRDSLSKGDRFDVCFVDCTDVAGPGPTDIAATLITDEFLDNICKILTPDGIMVAQSESPVYSASYVKHYSQRLSARFPHVATYVIMVPSYAGIWSLTWASKSIDPSSEITRIPPEGLKYYRPELFRAALEMGRLEFWGPPPEADSKSTRF